MRAQCAQVGELPSVVGDKAGAGRRTAAGLPPLLPPPPPPSPPSPPPPPPPPPPTYAASTFTELRDVVNNQTGELGDLVVELPEGARLEWAVCSQLRVHVAHMTLRSVGAGATLDARNCSRHFDVAFGGTLELERVHLVNGGAQASGGAVKVRHGRTLIEDMTAAVFMLGDLDECIGKRVRAFHASSGLPATWVLHSPNVSPSARKVAATLAADGVLVEEQPRVPSHWRSFGASKTASGQILTVPSFLLWLLHKPEYSNAWHIEDDVFFTGQWKELVSDARWQGQDLVSGKSVKFWSDASFRNWLHADQNRICKLPGGVPCEQGPGAGPTVAKVMWPLARLSRSLAFKLAEALNNGAGGHNEVATGALCDYFNATNKVCQTKPIPKQDLGRYMLGMPDCKLNISERKHTKLSQHCKAAWPPSFLNSTLVQQHRFFHPAKCSLRPDFGELQLEWIRRTASFSKVHSKIRAGQRRRRGGLGHFSGSDG